MTRNSHRFVAAFLAVAFGNSSLQAADLSGKFVYGAPAPAAAKLNIDKDVEAFGNLGLTDETLVVAPDGGIANVVVYVRTDGVAVTAEAEKAAPPKVEYHNKGGRFQPRILPVWVGKQTLVIKNSDPVGHTYQGFEGYLVVDARATWRIDPHWSAAVGVDNLTDSDYFVFHPFPQRSALAELRYVY